MIPCAGFRDPDRCGEKKSRSSETSEQRRYLTEKRQSSCFGLGLREIDMENVIRVLLAGLLLFGAAMFLLALLGDYLVRIH